MKHPRRVLNEKQWTLGRGIRDFLATIISRGGSTVAGLAMQSLLAWQLGPEGRGEYAVCLVFSSLVTVIFCLGADWGANYFIATKQFPRNQIITFSLVYIFVVSVLIIPAVHFVTRLDLAFFDKGSAGTWAFAGVWSASMVCFNFSTAIFSGMREFNIFAGVTFSRSLMTLMVTFGLLYSGNMGVMSPVVADIASCLIMTCLSIGLWVGNFNFRLEWPEFLLASNISAYGLRFFGGSLGMIANARIGTILLAFYVDKESLGYFALSMSFLAQLITVSDVTGRIIQPRVAESKDGRPDLVSLCCRMISLIILLLGVCLILFAEHWVAILFSKAFLPIIPIMIILIPGVWLRVIGKLLFPYFNGTNRPEIVTIATLITLLANLLFLLALIEPYGLKGAAWSVSLSYGLSTAYAVYKYCQLSGQKVWSLLVIHKEDFHLLAGQFRAHAKINSPS